MFRSREVLWEVCGLISWGWGYGVTRSGAVRDMQVCGLQRSRRATVLMYFRFPERALMSDGCGDCIGGGCDVGANGDVCVALMLECSLVICVLFSPVASSGALRAHGGWRSVLVTWRP